MLRKNFGFNLSEQFLSQAIQRNDQSELLGEPLLRMGLQQQRRQSKFPATLLVRFSD